jgi:hypothetical protein
LKSRLNSILDRRRGVEYYNPRGPSLRNEKPVVILDKILEKLRGGDGRLFIIHISL